MWGECRCQPPQVMCHKCMEWESVGHKIALQCFWGVTRALNLLQLENKPGLLRTPSLAHNVYYGVGTAVLAVSSHT